MSYDEMLAVPGATLTDLVRNVCLDVQERRFTLFGAIEVLEAFGVDISPRLLRFLVA